MDCTVCVICGNLVPLELAKTNARGSAVHEDCYALQMKLENVTTPVRKVPAATRDSHFL